MSRPLWRIAHDIRAAWPNVSPYAKPYVEAMCYLNNIDECYYEDPARSVVLYFLSNAASFRGEQAKALKLELKALLAD